MAEENINLGVGMAAAQNEVESNQHQAQAQPTAAALESATANVAEDYAAKAERSWDEAKVRVRSWQDESREYVRDNPTKAVLVAAGIGLVLGLMVPR